MSLPIQFEKLSSAVESALPQVHALLQRDAAPCNPMRRAEGQKCETKPPRESRSIKSILSPKQLMAISLLLAGKQVKIVASQLGINRATIFRWRRDPRFQAEVQRRAELADPVQRPKPQSVRARDSVDPDLETDRRPGQKSLSELRESNRRLYEKLARASSGRR